MELLYSSHRIKQVLNNVIKSFIIKNKTNQLICENLIRFIEVQNEIVIFTASKFNFIALYSNILIKNKDLNELKVSYNNNYNFVLFILLLLLIFYFIFSV